MTHEKSSISVLIKRLSNGESEAFDILLAKYRPYLKLVAQRTMREHYHRRFDASDVVQQACMEAFQGAEDFRGSTEQEFHGWITRILERNVVNFARRHTAQRRDARRERPLMLESDISLEWYPARSSGAGPSSLLLQGEAALALAETVAQLDKREQVAIQMRFLEGRKVIDIAKHLEATPAAVAGVLARAMSKLRRKLPDSIREFTR